MDGGVGYDQVTVEHSKRGFMRRPTWRRNTIVGLALLAVVGASSTGCMLARPSQSKIAAPPLALQAENVAFQSASGSLIHAWLARGVRGRGAVLLLHGVGDDRTIMLARLGYFHRSGLTVLAPDFQGHGESQGEHITFGALERFDAEAALRFLRTQVRGERVGVIGISMGGAAALLGDQPLGADAMVLESVYPTIRDAVADRLRVWLGPFGMLGPALAPVVIDLVSSDIGVREDQLRPIDHIGAVRAPLLLAAGTDDRYTTIDEARALFDHARASSKQFWAVKGAGHEDLFAFDPAEYERRVGGFLLSQLRTPTLAASNVSDGDLSRADCAASGGRDAEQRGDHRNPADSLRAQKRSCE